MGVLFNSSRPLGRCENLTAVWDAYDGAKRYKQGGFADVSGDVETIVVTDEFVQRKRPEQRVVMIAHGMCGGKVYGRDQRDGIFAQHPDACKLVNYYVASSEQGRRFAASSSGIHESRCLPLGMPRTDAYFGKSKGDGGTFMADHGRAYLYMPTFRAGYDEPLRVMDWARIDALLGDGEVLVVKRHFFQRPLVDGEHEHVIEVDSAEPSTPYLIDCDVLATDFSSVLFDGYVLGKPSVLTADGSDAYLKTRGMYWRYPTDYGSRSLQPAGNEGAFVRHLRDACETGMRDAERACLERTAGACDGHSTERVCELIRDLM